MEVKISNIHFVVLYLIVFMFFPSNTWSGSLYLCRLDASIAMGTQHVFTSDINHESRAYADAAIPPQLVYGTPVQPSQFYGRY